MDEVFGDVIYAYTRAQAIEDGVLVEVEAKFAEEAGFRLPVALTSAAYEKAVALPEGRPQIIPGGGFDTVGANGQSVRGRLWDVLNVARFAICGAPQGADRASFSVSVAREQGSETVRMYVHVGPGDDGSPVLTILLEGED
jgi:hypothetical protein